MTKKPAGRFCERSPELVLAKERGLWLKCQIHTLGMYGVNGRFWNDEVFMVKVRSLSEHVDKECG